MAICDNRKQHMQKKKGGKKNSECQAKNKTKNICIQINKEKHEN